MLPLKKGISKTILILTNVVTLFFLSIILFKEEYPKRIAGKLMSSFSKKTDVEVVNSDLQKMNDVLMPLYSEISSENSGVEFKILFIGNSLTRHGIAKEIGWTHISGMAATAENKDYVHLIFNQLRKYSQEIK